MATTVKQSFREYASNLNLTTRQETLVSQRRRNVTEVLRKEMYLHDEGSKVIGSWDRDTIIRYLSEGDVDMMVTLHYQHNERYNTPEGARAILGRFSSILSKAYPDTDIRIDSNCVTMQFSEFRLDVVPAFRYTEGFYTIPDYIQGKWIETDPFSFAEEMTRINKNMDGDFIPLVKMVKGWNREVGRPINSFHLECIMRQHYKDYTESYTFSSMLRRFFQNLPLYIQDWCYDPIRGGRVDLYLDQENRRYQVVETARKAAADSNEAYEDEEKYPSIATKEWKDLLGEFFPAYG